MPRTHLKVRLPAAGNWDRSYEIVFGVRLKAALREIRHEAGERPIFIITDSNVRRLYGGTVLSALGDRPRTGARNWKLASVPSGETSKSRRVKERLEDWLIREHASRDSLLVALGGGMVGDLTGFVAATLFRGVPYIHLPTTLLAQVDSSIGGKVAVNHPYGKNLIGAFHQPARVYIDVATLRTLSMREYRSGLAEVIKYGAIMDGGLFSFLETERSQVLSKRTSALARITRRCCQLKRSVVEHDEREQGLRRILNFGHTIGHAIESLSSFRLKHGEAVAIGMAAESRLSLRLGMLSEEQHTRLLRILEAYGLPSGLPHSIPAREILRATYHDKKVRLGSVQYTLLEEIGRARAGVTVRDAVVLDVL